MDHWVGARASLRGAASGKLRGVSRPTDEEIVRGIADALPVGVWVARAPGGEFVYANATFMEIMGMAARDDVAVGEYADPYKIHDRDGAPYPEDRMPFVRALAERQTVMVDDLVIHRRDGGRVAVRAYARPLFDGDTITHVVICFFDITREVEAERARAQSEALMQRAQRMESIGNLAGGIAHDFNNLLGAVKAIASSLALDETDPARLSDFEVIDSATDSAARLTRALLGFAGQGKHLSKPTRLDDVVRRVVGLFGRALDGRVGLDLDLGAPREIEGDPSQLEQVVMNLLLNARDAVAGGGTIVVRTRDEGPEVWLEVQDDGPGVPDEIRDRIFEPYFSTRTRGGQRSTGLGLATSYGIVEAHAGRLELVSDAGRGARFRAAFPALAPADVCDPSPEKVPLVSGAGLILVVEDERLVRLSITRALSRAGYEVIEAADGLEGVERFRERHGELAGVVLDLNMPGLDGEGAYRQMRSIDPDVPVLLTTGYALNERAQRLLDHGVRGFIEKPFDIARLSEAVSRMLAG